MTPYCVEESLLHFNCPMKEIVTYKIAKDEDGYVDYMGIIPEGKGTMVILAVEADDGLFVLAWEKR